MKKIRKLTPALLKRIIAEEKAKIQKLRIIKEERDAIVKQRKRKTSASGDLDTLKKLRMQQRKAALQFKKIYEARKRIKKRLLKRL